MDIIKDRIQNGANLLESHVFQFDFLNDSFDKLPKGLQTIIKDAEERKKLVIYINPPYAEVSSVGIKGKLGVNQSKIHDKYISQLGTAGREIYTQFIARIYVEISGCILAEFSTLKTLQGSAFNKFRHFFEANLEKCFVVPANTFDNVNGVFPIGFKIWNTNKKDKFEKIIAEVYDEKSHFLFKKLFYAPEKSQFINTWISSFKINAEQNLGFLAGTNGNDFQQNNIIYILNEKNQMANPRGIWISKENLTVSSIYFTVRKCIKATWLNDRDQFLYPNEKWEKDKKFQNDCLTFTLFHGQNKISSKFGKNHWIPFTEQEVNAQDEFESNFMANFIAGKLKEDNRPTMFAKEKPSKKSPLEFSKEAKAVFEAGKALWAYYHAQENANPNASLYDIKEYFQGRSEKRMNNKSEDEIYTKLIAELRESLTILAKKIEPKVYEYGFLKA